jgi:hypothetical protein
MVRFAFAGELPMMTLRPVLMPDDALDMGLPDGKSHTVNLPLEGSEPEWPQRTARLLNVPLVFMRICCRACGPGLCVQEFCEPPAPNRRIVLDEAAVSEQKACAVRAL